MLQHLSNKYKKFQKLINITMVTKRFDIAKNTEGFLKGSHFFLLTF